MNVHLRKLWLREGWKGLKFLPSKRGPITPEQSVVHQSVPELPQLSEQPVQSEKATPQLAEQPPQLPKQPIILTISCTTAFQDANRTRAVNATQAACHTTASRPEPINAMALWRRILCGALGG